MFVSRSSCLSIGLACLLIAGSTSVAFTQEQQRPRAAEGGGGGRRAEPVLPQPEKMGPSLEAMTSQLKLTPAQQETIKGILSDRDLLVSCQNDFPNTTADDMKLGLFRVKQMVNTRIASALNPTQQADFEKMIAN